MKRGSLLLTILLVIIVGCQETQERNLRPITSDQGGVATQIPTRIPVSNPTIFPTSTDTPSPTKIPTLAPTPSEIPPTIEVQEPVTPSLEEIGRLYFSRPSWYGWFDLAGRDSAQEFIIDSSNEYHQFASHELIDGPGDHTQFEFSHYADLIAYASFTAYPGEFWLSDVAYEEPRKLFIDSDGRFDSEDPDYLDPWWNLNLVWSADDKHIFLYHVAHPELSLVYHLELGEFEEWNWKCDSIILSEQSGRLATLCPRVATAAQDQKAYAVLEWGGEIWYSDTLPGELFLTAADDGTTLWEWSADGEHLAYYDPLDLEGNLMIADRQGNTQIFLPGISVFSQNEAADIEYSPRSVLNLSHFVWAKNASVLLIKGYAQPESPCPPFVTEYNPDIYVEQWPCWQAINVEDGKVIWSEANIDKSLSMDEAGEAPFYIGISDLTVSPDGCFIAFHSFEPYRRTVVVDLWSGQATTILEFDAVDKLYWTYEPGT